MGKRARSRSDAGEPDSASSPEPEYLKGPLGIKRRKRTPFSQRERLGHEAPGSVLRGPPITVDCECGESTELRYGEGWTCPKCERVYDTTEIPHQQYEAVRKLQLRFRLLPIALGLGTLTLAVFFTLVGNVFGVFILIPSASVAWFMVVRPIHRRRFEAAASALPSWELRAKQSV
jgi:hypothetical protein